MPIVLGQELLSPTQYENEGQLESAVCCRPELLLDEADLSDQRRKIAFVDKQVQLPNAGRLDVLFITDDGVPIAVEVKLEKNAQSRREVVAQAIDYASDLTSMTVDEVDDLVEGRLEAAVYQVIEGTNLPFDDIWKRVGTNLRAGRARIMVVLDEVSPGLERIFHFLTRSSTLDVYLITVKSYSSQAGKIVVSRRCVSPVFEEQQSTSVVAAQRQRPRSIRDDALITVLTEKNPKRPGSAAFERFKLYRTGMTVGDFLRAGGTRADISWDRSHKFITLDSPP